MSEAWKKLFPSGNPLQGPNWPEYLHIRLAHDWALSPTCIDNCENYFLRHWETKYLLDQFLCTNHPDYIEYQGIKYNLRWVMSLTTVMKYKQAALSFRKPKPELNLPAYVLVKGIAS